MQPRHTPSCRLLLATLPFRESRVARTHIAISALRCLRKAVSRSFVRCGKMVSGPSISGRLQTPMTYTKDGCNVRHCTMRGYVDLQESWVTAGFSPPSHACPPETSWWTSCSDLTANTKVGWLRCIALPVGHCCSGSPTTMQRRASMSYASTRTVSIRNAAIGGCDAQYQNVTAVPGRLLQGLVASSTLPPLWRMSPSMTSSR